MKVVEDTRFHPGLAKRQTVFVEGVFSLWFKASYSECNFGLTGHAPVRIEGCDGLWWPHETNEPDNSCQ
jgi:hypothetical protein